MALINKVPQILKHVQNNRQLINYNTQLFEINEGDLLKHLKEKLNKTAASNATKISTDRAAPINILKKVLEKLSKIYKQDPHRMTENPNDLEIIKTYEGMGVNSYLNDTNTNYNLYKNSVTEIYEDPELRQVRFRSIPSTQFIPYSDDPVNPLRVTEMVKFMGTILDEDGAETEKFWIYSDEEFISVDSKGRVVTQDLTENLGVNPYGVIPLPYVSRSRYLLIPMMDSDTLAIVLLVAELLTDLNFASKFLSNPILYGIDIDSDNFEMSPNIFWNVKSEIEGKNPSLNVLRAEPDISGQLELIKNELALWLESRNIKPGTIGRLTGENFASGIAMMLSEMDTANDIMIQQQVFKEYEVRFWRALAKVHNELARTNSIEDNRLFSNPDTLIVHTDFRELKPFEGRAEKVERLAKEVEAGFMSKRQAVKELNPKLSDEEIEKILEEIENETAFSPVEEEDGN